MRGKRKGGRTAPQLPQVLLEPSDEAPHLGQAVPCILGKVLLTFSLVRVCVRAGFVVSGVIVSLGYMAGSNKVNCE